MCQYDIAQYSSFLRLHVTQNVWQLPFFFFLFLIPNTVFGQTGKIFLSDFNVSLAKTRETSIGSVSLDTLTNVFVLVLFTVLV